VAVLSFQQSGPALYQEDLAQRRKGAKRCRVSKRAFFAPLRLCARNISSAWPLRIAGWSSIS